MMMLNTTASPIPRANTGPSMPGSAKNENSRPISRPVKTPFNAPPAITDPQLRRPVTRSISFRSVPQIMRFSTGNPLSERKSTAFWASA